MNRCWNCEARSDRFVCTWCGATEDGDDPEALAARYAEEDAYSTEDEEATR